MDSLFSMAKALQETAEVQQAVIAEKEFQSLKNQRLGSKRNSLNATQINDFPVLSVIKSHSHLLASSDNSFFVAPPKRNRSHDASNSSGTVFPTDDVMANIIQNESKNRHSRSSSYGSDENVRLFRVQCAYKKPDSILKKSHFKTRFIVIDTLFQSIRIYANEKLLLQKTKPKQELLLNEAYVQELQQYSQPSTPTSNVAQDMDIVLHIGKQIHIFRFNDNNKYEQTLININKCCSLASSASTIMNINKMVAVAVNEDVQDDELLPTSLNALQLAYFINKHKHSANVSQILQLKSILETRDHTFTQDFIAAQGLTYLCSICLIFADEWEMLSALLLVFRCIMDVRDSDGFDFIGFKLIVEHTHCIQCITDMFENRNTLVRCQILRLLTAFCQVDYSGFERVISALDDYGDNHNASTIFDAFVRSLYFESDLCFRRDALRFVNGILIRLQSIEDRIEARHFLTELGYKSIMEQIWDDIEGYVKLQENEMDTDLEIGMDVETETKTVLEMEFDEKEYQTVLYSFFYDQLFLSINPFIIN